VVATLAVLTNHKSLGGKVLWHERNPRVLAERVRREELSKELLHDYSTSSTGVVPLTERRSLYHFVALWMTLAAGFTYLFLGFQYHDAGWSAIVLPWPPW
jgi:hypothetical protein